MKRLGILFQVFIDRAICMMSSLVFFTFLRGVEKATVESVPWRLQRKCVIYPVGNTVQQIARVHTQLIAKQLFFLLSITK